MSTANKIDKRGYFTIFGMLKNGATTREISEATGRCYTTIQTAARILKSVASDPVILEPPRGSCISKDVYAWAKEFVESSPKEYALAMEAPEDAYNRGLNEAWNTAGALVSYLRGDLPEIYDFPQGADPLVAVFLISPQDAIEILAKYMRAKEDIKIGDEVICDQGRGAVVKISKKSLTVWLPKGNVVFVKKQDVSKTGEIYQEVIDAHEALSRGEK